MPPGLAHILKTRPLVAYIHTPAFGNGEPLLRLAYSAFAFPLALRSPFETLVRIAIPPPAILCAAFERFYLPFIIGLLYYITGTPICQVFFEKKSDFVGRAQSILNFTQFCVQYHG